MEVALPELLVDTPLLLGCFVPPATFPASHSLAGTNSHTECVLACHGSGLRFAAVQDGDCHCLAGMAGLDWAGPDQCSTPCPAQPDQLCGGPGAVGLLVAECESGWTRLGSSCLQEQRDPAPEWRAAQDSCAHAGPAGAALWWPQDMTEFAYVISTLWSKHGCVLDTDDCHLFLGLRDYTEKSGFIAADLSRHIGIKETY